MLLNRTRVLCAQCGTPHPGEVVIEDGTVYGVTHCDRGEVRHRLSSNAELFLKIRNRSQSAWQEPAPPGLKYFLNYISITNACNFKCAVCAAREPDETHDIFLPVEEILRRAREVQRHGGRILHLFGGEPTLHPELLTIVGQLHQMGFKVGLVSNGFNLGRDPRLALALKEHGLARVCLQFDSFNRATLRKLNRVYLPEKLNAIRNVLDAGLALGLNCTVTKDNLPELADLLAHHLELRGNVCNLTFATAAPSGRYDLDLADTVDREQMIAALLPAGEKYGFGIEDFYPMPSCLPWGLSVHPDCGVHIMFVKTRSGVRPAGHFIAAEKFYRRLARIRLAPGFFSKTLLPFVIALSCAKGAFWVELAKALVGLLRGRKPGSLINVGVTDYRAAMFLDEQRTGRCASAFYTSAGPVSGCIHFFGGDGHQGSRKKEVERGLC